MRSLECNAPELFNRDGDFVGYAVPNENPVSIETKWIKNYRNGPDGFEDTDELIYLAKWANGIFAEYATLPTEWRDLLPVLFARNFANAMQIGPKEGFTTLSQNTISYKLEAAE